MVGLCRDIGIDLGTANTLVCVRGKGIVIREPSVVAIDRQSGGILAFGEEARKMLGRTPGRIVATRPLREGVIADYTVTEEMLRHYIGRVCGRRSLLRPRVMICVPSGTTSVEKRAVLEAARSAGARKTFLVEEPLAAALGAGMDISRPAGGMVVDIGGGTSDVAVLSLNGVVVSSSLRTGGDRLDESIVRYIRKEHNLLIGERTAEEVKLSIGTAGPLPPAGDAVDVRGRDLVSGLPKTIRFTARESCLAMDECLRGIVDLVRAVMERTPPELASDILARGMVLTGGGALLTGLDRLLARETGVPVVVAEDPLSCVALGAAKALESLDELSAELISVHGG